MCLQAADGSDVLLYGADAAAAAGGLMEASYRNLQEARVALQAVYALMTAGAWLEAANSQLVVSLISGGFHSQGRSELGPR